MPSVEDVVAALPRRFPGPGGACAVIRDGIVIARHAWGWADCERRIPFTPHTLFRICSITKQFTCALMLDVVNDPAVLDPAVAARLPSLAVTPPTATHLAHNQSGLRDYWAVAMLHGSPAEAPFGDVETGHILRGTQTLQFHPGTRYSYCNQNFRILSDVLQSRTGRSFAELLRRRLFDPAAMPSALLAADTAALPDGTTGYEGSQALGFRPACNRVVWTGDAGMAASLDDMIAWECFIDRTRDDPAGLYNRLSTPVFFAGGTPAAYGFGLGRSRLFGRAVTAHGGALRGWRSHRLHVAADRLSVVVLFNHMADAQAAAQELLASCLGEDAQQPTGTAAMPPIAGAFVEPETGLAVQIQAGPPGTALLRYDRFPERLRLQADGMAGQAGEVRLSPDNGAVWMDRPIDNQCSRLVPRPAGLRRDWAGRYRCAELDAELTIVEAGGALYGAFSGFLGRGRMELLESVADDLWTLPCPRALDHTPPGDWTLDVVRDGAGSPETIRVGCWLARGLSYRRVAMTS